MALGKASVQYIPAKIKQKKHDQTFPNPISPGSNLIKSYQIFSKHCI
jgi:hypothetical protein